MARSLTFLMDGTPASIGIEKVDRKKVYGWVDKKAFDRDGNECYMGSLSADGISIFGKDSFELGYSDSEGEWVEKKELQTLNEDGEVLEKTPSSFKAEIELGETATIDEYLLHAVKSVYHLSGDDLEALAKRVASTDGIITFPFNYVDSYFPDTAFLVENEGELFMVVGVKADFEFVGLEQQAALADEEEEEDEEEVDAFDFGMM